MSFNEMMERLEQIVKLLEGGEQTLERSIELYKEATDLAAKCESYLSKAELTVKSIDSVEAEQNG